MDTGEAILSGFAGVYTQRHHSTATLEEAESSKSFWHDKLRRPVAANIRVYSLFGVLGRDQLVRPGQ